MKVIGKTGIYRVTKIDANGDVHCWGGIAHKERSRVFRADQLREATTAEKRTRKWN